MVAIEMRSVQKVFDSGGHRVTALESISCEIREGEFFCIIGPSGCGKTTLLHIIAGFTTPSGGDVRYRGNHIAGPGPDRIVIFQEYGLFPWMTVAENIEFGLEAKGLGARQRRELVRGYVDLVHLSGFEARYPHQISGGMKQRVGIARALAPDPAVVLMDEPFGALDSLTRDLMQEEILRIWERTRKTVVLITHNIEEAIFLGDRVMVMTARPGRVKELVDIGLSRPRSPEMRSSDPKFLKYKDTIFHALRAEVSELVE